MELIEYLNSQNAPSTAQRYQREIALYFVFLSQQKINPEIATHSQIMDYIGKLRTKSNNLGCSLHAIKKYYSYLLAAGIRQDNPAKSIRLRDKPSRDIQLQDLVKPEELEQLLDRKERYILLENRNKIAISLVIYQALTNAEVKNLEITDINLEEGTIYIKPGRRTNKRTLKLRSKQVFWIMKYLQEDRPKIYKGSSNILIVSNRKTSKTEGLLIYLFKTQKHLFPDRKLNAKTIRQSVITNFLKDGKDLRIVQAFAGHRYPSSTERYKQTQVEELKNQILKYHPLQ